MLSHCRRCRAVAIRRLCFAIALAVKCEVRHKRPWHITSSVYFLAYLFVVSRWCVRWNFGDVVLLLSVW